MEQEIHRFEIGVTELSLKLVEETDPISKADLMSLARNQTEILKRKQGSLEECKRGLESLERRIASPAILPDSERLIEILPGNTDTTLGANFKLHFVNRDVAMKRLLFRHLSMCARRSGIDANTGLDIDFPLMDSAFGMGKTTFAKKYLAMVARYVQGIRKEFGQNGKQLSDDDIENLTLMRIEDDISNRVHLESEFDPENPSVGPRRPDPNVVKLVRELLCARTLYVDISQRPLIDPDRRQENLLEMIRAAISEQWGVFVDCRLDWCDLVLTYLPRPVFIVFDEIGASFGVKDPKDEFTLGDISYCRGQFLNFVEDYCKLLSKTAGVYYLLCGKNPFLFNVGMRDETHPMFEKNSPGAFHRINLNPIRHDHIREIVQKTFIAGKSVSEYLLSRCPGMEIDEIIGRLYVRSAGHPRSLAASCEASVRGAQPLETQEGEYSEKLVSDVKVALRKYPKGIKELFESRKERCDLTRTYQENGESVISFEHLAILIFAGYCLNLSSTPLFFAPAIELFLTRYFSPFAEFVLTLDKLIKEKYLDKSRMFEILLLKWFESIAKSNRTIEESWKEFCPSDSKLRSAILKHDLGKTVDGLKILEPGKQSGESTLSVQDFASKISEYLDSGSAQIYFPAPKSRSPDFLLIQPQGEGRNDLIIGIQAKCHSTGAIGANDCIDEGQKFFNIFEQARSLRKKGLDGIFVMCTTGQYTKKNFEDLNKDKRSLVWKGKPTEWGDRFEFLILHLSTAELRKSFFGLVEGVAEVGATAPSAAGDRVFEIIEEMTKYK